MTLFMKILSLLIIIIFMFTGCAKLKHLPQLLTLKSLGEGQADMDDYVKEQDAKFALMLEDIKKNEIKEHSHQNAIVRHYGEPVFKREITDQDDIKEEWLYRRAVEYFKTDKVYMYFDDKGRLIKWDYIPKPELSEAKNGGA